MDSTLDAIEAATLEILERDGAGAVSMRAVAKAVGITPMAIYHYFPDRDALLRRVTDREFGKLLDYLEAGRRGKHGEERVVALLDGYLDYAYERPRIFDAVFSRPRPDARLYPVDLRQRGVPTLTPVADALAAEMAAGRLRRDDEWEAALELWALAHGYVALRRAGRFQLGEGEFRALVRRAMRRLLEGLKVRPGEDAEAS
ncbi:MAG: TetR family transcriptional regulator [Acidobacteria bacterium]|nr:TetR family transcriptional regulator [Acidobacteriota bacterium]